MWHIAQEGEKRLDLTVDTLNFVPRSFISIYNSLFATGAGVHGTMNFPEEFVLFKTYSSISLMCLEKDTLRLQ